MPPTTTPLAALRTFTRASQSTIWRLPSRQPLPSYKYLFQRPRSSLSNSVLQQRTFSTYPRSLSIESPSASRLVEQPASADSEPPQKRPEQPSYDLTFTCTPCSTRSKHRISKQGYHKGSVLVTCPECRNRHVISDHLNIFGDRHLTIEDLMKERGQLVKRGTLSEDGDLEFWEDGTTTKREKSEES